MSAASAEARVVRDQGELIAEDRYARAHEEAALRLHGGFDAAGRYLSPRTRHRWPAVRAWEAQLAARGWPLLDTGPELLSVPPFPNEAQARLLLRAGLGQFFWDSLTITGIIEARGEALAAFDPPDLQPFVDADLAGTCLGHLGKGLFRAHGWDEGGRRDLGLGGHDTMWFAVRDLLFGPDRWSIPEAPASIGRDVPGRELPELPEAIEGLLKLMMNVRQPRSAVEPDLRARARPACKARERRRSRDYVKRPQRRRQAALGLPQGDPGALPGRVARPSRSVELRHAPRALPGSAPGSPRRGSTADRRCTIEVRAERTFRYYEAVIGTPGLFGCRDADRDLALELVDRIRTDEAIHVAYLRCALSEFRSFPIRTLEGRIVEGRTLLDPLWEAMIRWHAVGIHEANRPAQVAALRARVEAHPEGARLWARLGELGGFTVEAEGRA